VFLVPRGLPRGGGRRSGPNSAAAGFIRSCCRSKKKRRVRGNAAAVNIDSTYSTGIMLPALRRTRKGREGGTKLEKENEGLAVYERRDPAKDRIYLTKGGGGGDPQLSTRMA